MRVYLTVLVLADGDEDRSMLVSRDALCLWVVRFDLSSDLGLDDSLNVSGWFVLDVVGLSQVAARMVCSGKLGGLWSGVVPGSMPGSHEDMCPRLPV